MYGEENLIQMLMAGFILCGCYAYIRVFLSTGGIFEFIDLLIVMSI
jgi:hypothetical protein